MGKSRGVEPLGANRVHATPAWRALSFLQMVIEASFQPGDVLTQHFVRELHSMTVANLDREGDRTPGGYRTGAVKIALSKHLPPDAIPAMPDLQTAQRTYQLKKLIGRGMLRPIQPGARQYTLGFSNNYLMRGVVRALASEGFIPEPVSYSRGRNVLLEGHLPRNDRQDERRQLCVKSRRHITELKP